MDIYDRRLLLQSFHESDERLRFSKALNQAYLCLESTENQYSAFLDPYRLESYLRVFRKCRNAPVAEAFGGYSGAERKRIGFFASEAEGDFGISLVRIAAIPKAEKLAHRDVLGSIIGLGVERDYVGDIAVFEDCAYALLDEDAAGKVIQELTKVGNCGVSCERREIDELPPAFADSLESVVFVSSPRIDALVSRAFGIKRAEAQNEISSGRLFINWAEQRSYVKDFAAGDIITLRGRGRIEVLAVEPGREKYQVRIKKTI